MILRPAIAILLALVPGPLRAQQPAFVPAPTSPVEVGEGSGTILLQDIDRDRRADLLSRHLLTRRIVLMRGDGQGGFSPFGAALEFDYEPGDMKLGDVNRDGIPDLVVTASQRDQVDVLLGDGAGRFRKVSGSPFTLSRVIDTYNKRTLHLVDLDGDGDLDIATANGRLRNTVRTLLGDGRGRFSSGPVVRLDTRGDGFALAFADMNGDGHLDVVNASKGEDGAGRLMIQLGDGRGNFGGAAGSAIRISPAPSAVVPTDLNGDGRTDILVAHSPGKVSRFLNRGQQVFEQVPDAPVEVGGGLFALVAMDLNGDKLPDLALPTVDHVTVLLAQGDGFSPAPGSPYKAGPDAYYVGAGDLNGDGKTDLVASSFEGTQVTVLLGR